MIMDGSLWNLYFDNEKNVGKYFINKLLSTVGGKSSFCKEWFFLIILTIYPWFNETSVLYIFYNFAMHI